MVLRWQQSQQQHRGVLDRPHAAVPLSRSCTITITITAVIAIAITIIIIITITITIIRRVTTSSSINTTQQIMPVPQKKMKPGPTPQKIIQLNHH